MTIRTRFAPSPTGSLHIGGARTALFNYLFARHSGGEFLLRIEDTDRARSTPEAVDAIFKGLEWLGLDWDNKDDVLFQATREKRHAELAYRLLEEGKAYKCFATAQELEEMREAARAEGKAPRYNGLWRDKTPGPDQENAPFAVRLKAPRDGSATIKDLIQGDVTVANKELDDLILLRSDGTPTYLLAVVADDHDMEITHVIRGDDHLTNTFRQKLIYDALGWETPHFAHLPLIHGPDGAKLSKRHGAQSVIEFKEYGLLPEALCNYLLRLGWGHGDAEILDREEQIKLFTLGGVGKSASRMDYAKLEHVNGVWLRKASPEHLADLIVPALLEKNPQQDAQALRERFVKLVPLLQERAKNLNELRDSALFLIEGAPFEYAPKTEKNLKRDGREILAAMLEIFKNLPNFTKDEIHQALAQFGQERELGLGKIAGPLRGAVTGTTSSPSIDATLAALGRDLTCERIERVLKNPPFTD